MSSMTMSSSTPIVSRAVDWRQYVFVALGTVGAALLANIIVYLIGSVIVGYDQRFLPLATVGGTLVFTIVPAIVAVLLYALLLRFTSSPARIFTSLAAVVLVISLIPDLTYVPSVPGASTGQIAVLMVMHVVAAVVIVSMLTRLSSPRPR